MTEQQKSDYYYGYNLRLADELGEYENHVMQPSSLEDRIKLNNELRCKLLLGSRRCPDSFYPEDKMIVDVFNDPIDELEKEYYDL